ncbi:hypothetical protein LTR04_005711, partial [Oleoguttula sp. CCFEE 6159]
GRSSRVVCTRMLCGLRLVPRGWDATCSTPTSMRSSRDASKSSGRYRLSGTLGRSRSSGYRSWGPRGTRLSSLLRRGLRCMGRRTAG